jgi:anti-sigma regulatory factor (Ser/Thr protein kinase)
MRVYFSNSAWIQNIGGFFSTFDPSDPGSLDIRLHNRWVSVHPAILALTACAAKLVREAGGQVTGDIPRVATLPYLIRMGLFDFLGLDPGRTITQHEAAGRFVPLTSISTNAELRHAITELVPLLHAPAEVAAPIKYVFSEMVRNALEHSHSPIGSIVCAQYFKKTNRISIGIADAGVGILGSMRRFHPVSTPEKAICLALQPGITGATAKVGGNEFNAGAGLFFTKSIAALSRNYFLLYSGDAAFKLLKSPEDSPPQLSANPLQDRHRLIRNAPDWSGTVVGIDINVEQGRRFADLLDDIRKAYSIDVRARQKAYYKKVRFIR